MAVKEARVANETGLTRLMKGMPLSANGCPPRRGVTIPSVGKKGQAQWNIFRRDIQRELLGSKDQRVNGIRLQERDAYLVLNERKTTKVEPRSSTSERESQAENSDLQKTGSSVRFQFATGSSTQ